MNRALSAVVASSLALCLLSGCSHDAAAQSELRLGTAERLADGAVRIREDSLPFIAVEAVGDTQVPTLVRAPARLAFRDGAASEVGSPVDGRVTEVHVHVGQRVGLGDPLVTIASPSAAGVRGELARARVMVRSAEAELARQEQMRSAGVGIESDRVRAEADLAQARAMLSAASASAASIGRGSAASVVVRAPITGTVLTRRASVGLAVEAGGDPLLVVGEPGAVWIVSEVFERELPLIAERARAAVTLASLGTPLEARVESIGGAVDPQTRRAPVYLALDGSAPAQIRAGMYARVEIEVGDAGLGVPTSSILVKDGGRTIVFVQRDERTFVPREVHVGPPVRGRAPVLSGLERGDRIVTRGALLLDGQADLLR
jgi:cobalt-zinc-cadmium efflux system membrane fusion protein